MAKVLDSYHQLRQSIPVPALRLTNPEACEYCDYTHYSQNCHYCILCLSSQACSYCFLCNGKHLVDCLYCGMSELCYESIECLDLLCSSSLPRSPRACSVKRKTVRMVTILLTVKICIGVLTLIMLRIPVISTIVAWLGIPGTPHLVVDRLRDQICKLCSAVPGRSFFSESVV